MIFFLWLSLFAGCFVALWVIALWAFRPKYESLSHENVHAWVDSLRARGVEVIEELPEINPFK